MRVHRKTLAAYIDERVTCAHTRIELNKNPEARLRTQASITNTYMLDYYWISSCTLKRATQRKSERDFIALNSMAFVLLPLVALPAAAVCLFFSVEFEPAVN